MQLFPEGLYSGPAIIGRGVHCVTIGELLGLAVAGISKEISYTWSLLYIIKSLDSYEKNKI